MKLAELLDMWKGNDVQDVVLVENKEREDGFIDHLYHILFKYRTDNYGRHAGLRVRLNRVMEVVEHDIFNMTIDDRGNWVEAVTAWFTTWTNATTYYVNSTYSVNDATDASFYLSVTADTGATA